MDVRRTPGDTAAEAAGAPQAQAVVQPAVIEAAIAAAAACERVCAAHAAEAHGDEQDLLAITQDTADICRAVVSSLLRWTPDGGRHIDLLVEACAVACASCADAARDGSEIDEAAKACRAALLVLMAAAHAQEP